MLDLELRSDELSQLRDLVQGLLEWETLAASRWLAQ